MRLLTIQADTEA